jgi:hypothetical protein
MYGWRAWAGASGGDAGGEEERAHGLHVTAGFGEAKQVTEQQGWAGRAGQ